MQEAGQAGENMLILFEHVEYFRWEATEGEGRRRNALPFEQESGNLGTSLVAFVNVEQGDGENGANIERAVKMIDKMALDLEVENMVLYPFAHLTPEGHATHDSAVDVIAELGRQIVATGSAYHLVSIPFGCSKMRESKVLGHNKAVLLRSIR